MWKYSCQRMLMTLLGAFLIGFLSASLFNVNELFMSMAQETLPTEAVSILTANPVLLNISMGLGFAGMLNIFAIGQLLSIYYGGANFMFLLAFILFPDFAVLAGIIALPVTVILFLYGWISLNQSVHKDLRLAKITGDDEIVRMYELRHPLDDEYRALGESVRKTMRTVQLAYALGLTAVICVMVFVNNLWIVMILIIVCMFGFQALGRIRSSAFMSITRLLYDECDPEACMSALLYYSRRGNHYRIANRALAAQCLMYLDEPELAQDVLIEYRRASTGDELQYYSILGNVYYQLKDESGLSRCMEAIDKLRIPRGPMGMVYKSQQMGMLENKLNLMHGDFNTCKKYFLTVLQTSQMRLQKAESAYFIALISFVQQDYVVAKMYFEKTMQLGPRLYYAQNAARYLDKIEQSHLLEEPDE